MTEIPVGALRDHEMLEIEASITIHLVGRRGHMYARKAKDYHMDAKPPAYYFTNFWHALGYSLRLRGKILEEES